MIRLKKIGSKLLISYFIILFVAFLVTVVSYNVLSQRYFMKEAKSQMRTEGQTIAKTLGKMKLKDHSIGEKILVKKELRVAGRFIESKVIVFNKDKRIIYTNWKSLDREKMKKFIREKDKPLEGYITEKVPIKTPKGGIKGYVFLMMELKELKAMNEIMKTTRILSFTVAGFTAIIIGILLQKGLTNPIRELMKTMMNFSLKDFDKDFRLETGDEIEELSICFSSLVKKLKKYDRQQKTFLQNTSHELKTPLMSIQGYAEAIKDGIVEGAEMEESLDIIMNQCQRMKKTVDEITYLTKLENVEEIFRFEECDMDKLVEDALRSIQPLADEKNIKIDVKGDFDYKGFYDGDKIKRAFINILSNAIRYAKENIIIQSFMHDPYYEIHIIDDGEGLKAGEEEKVFDRFYKGDKGNTGLGLSITKAIIEGHDGEITVYNHKEKGAIFKIKLPKGL
ncbi:HAMP domain-containing sensor histidine kinase [Crassaminicella profunda]|uniref:HAMP domain-containing sensor histidine kinase n=1 Tax=Crassaminicella profunda TaxID=1286698 RepID=UPI001CA6A9D3|nr:HAMP domain-containing sensor histidine kinase [Crassaminicella profunda]QZY55614.1 HAMP domain-containing histidine kinase [Crassaminicella profunda]